MRKLGSYRNNFHQACHGDGHNFHLLLHLLLQLREAFKTRNRENLGKIPNRGGGSKKIHKVPKFHLGNFSEFSQSSQVHKKGGQKGLKTLIRPYIFRKFFTKFPSSEKGGGSRFLTLFPSSQSSQPPQGGGVNSGWEFFPSFTMLEF